MDKTKEIIEDIKRSIIDIARKEGVMADEVKEIMKQYTAE